MTREIRIGQHWKDQDGHLYRITSEGGELHFYAKHPNSKGPSMMILKAWLPYWTKTKEAT